MRLLASLASHLNPSRSLRTRLGLAIAGTAIILSIFASLIVGHTASAQVKINVGQSLTELAYQMTDKLDRGMFERYRDLQIISTLNAFRSPDTPILEQRNLLEKLQSTYPNYAWLGFTDTRGVVRASTGKLLEGKNVKQRPWFVAGEKAAYVGDVHEAVKLAKLLPNPTGEPLRFVDVAVPVRDLQGSFRGVLGAHLSWTWAKEVENSLLYPLQGRNLEMFVFRQNGELLLSPSGLTTQVTARNLLASLSSSYPQKRNGYTVETWSDGNTYLTGFALSKGYRDYPGLGWIVLVRQKTEIAFAPVQRLQQQIFGWNLVFGGLFAAIAYLAADRITKPILAIASSAETIRQGDTALKIPIVRGKDETARLSKSLHRLVSTLTQQEGDLKSSNQQLQQKLSEIQQVEERYRQLAEAVPQLIWTLDVDGKVEYVNQQWMAYTGLNLEQTIVSGWDTVHPDDYAYARQVWLEAQASSTSLEAQYRYRGANNNYRWYLVRALPFKNEQGKVVKWLGTSTDIDKQKQWEGERDRILQQEKKARADAESANRLKDEFIAMLSHELRTPLNPILGWVKLLQRGKLNEVKTAEALVTIERNAKLQLELIEDLLSVSQILQGKLNLKITSVDLQSIVLAAIETVRLAAEAKHIEIVKYFVPVGKVTGDPARLQQVFWNLISNAIKFTPENGRVEVQIVEVDDYAQIQISDTGKGINPDFIPYIFDYFRQEDSTTTRKYGGLGLGLAIARNLVELHGGTISATSLGDGKGATFMVKLLVEREV